MQSGMLQKYDRFAIADFACVDHRKRVVDANFHYVYIFAFHRLATTCCDAIRRFIATNKKVQFFGYGGHVGFEYLAHVADTKTRLLFSLRPNAFLRGGIVEYGLPPSAKPRLALAQKRADTAPEAMMSAST